MIITEEQYKVKYIKYKKKYLELKGGRNIFCNETEKKLKELTDIYEESLDFEKELPFPFNENYPLILKKTGVLRVTYEKGGEVFSIGYKRNTCQNSCVINVGVSQADINCNIKEVYFNQYKNYLFVSSHENFLNKIKGKSDILDSFIKDNNLSSTNDDKSTYYRDDEISFYQQIIDELIPDFSYQMSSSTGDKESKVLSYTNQNFFIIRIKLKPNILNIRYLSADRSIQNEYKNKLYFDNFIILNDLEELTSRWPNLKLRFVDTYKKLPNYLITSKINKIDDIPYEVWIKNNILVIRDSITYNKKKYKIKV